MTIFSFSQWMTQAIAGLKEGEKCREKGFLTLPRIQIVTEGVSTKTPSNLAIKKSLNVGATSIRFSRPSIILRL
jgi:hypothetical protein